MWPDLKKLAVLTAALLPFNAHALQVLPLADNGSAVARISANELTRIAVKDGRIRQAFGAEGQLTVQADEENGQIFVRPLAPRPLAEGKRGDRTPVAPINLFLVDNAGRTYSLILQIEDIPAESILLSAPNAERQRAGNWERGNPYQDTLTGLVKAMATDEIPDGYEVKEVGSRVPIWKEVNLTFRRLYQGDLLLGESYQLSNVSDRELRLAEQEFLRRGVLAVSIENAILQPGQSTALYIVREADHGE